MANVKISELDVQANPKMTNNFVTVDMDEGTTKRISLLSMYDTLFETKLLVDKPTYKIVRSGHVVTVFLNGLSGSVVLDVAFNHATPVYANINNNNDFNNVYMACFNYDRIDIIKNGQNFSETGLFYGSLTFVVND